MEAGAVETEWETGRSWRLRVEQNLPIRLEIEQKQVIVPDVTLLIHLYDLHKDPHQMNNVAGTVPYLESLQVMRNRLFAHLRRTQDPRVVSGKVEWDYYPYYGLRRNKDWKVDPKP